MFSRLGKQAKRYAKVVGADSTYRMLEAYYTIKIAIVVRVVALITFTFKNITLINSADTLSVSII